MYLHIEQQRQSMYLQFPCHGDHVMIRWVVLVAVGEHDSDISAELLGVSVLSLIHLPLRNTKHRRSITSPQIT